MLRKLEHSTVGVDKVLFSARACCSNYIYFFHFGSIFFWNPKNKRQTANHGKQLNVNYKELQRCKPTFSAAKVYKTLFRKLLILSKIWEWRTVYRTQYATDCFIILKNVPALTLLANKFLHFPLPLRPPPLRKANLKNHIIRDKKLRA